MIAKTSHKTWIKQVLVLHLHFIFKNIFS